MAKKPSTAAAEKPAPKAKGAPKAAAKAGTAASTHELTEQERVPKGAAAKKSTGKAPKGEKVEAAGAKTSTKGPSKALGKPVTPSKDLAEIVGSEPLPRTAVVSKMWDYIRKHDLQNPEDKREIMADDKLKTIFGKDKATMFELNKLLSSHLV
jgi:chromatin remodeling complex protein RSC6